MNLSLVVPHPLRPAACALFSASLFAASGTWIGGSGNWSDTANWDVAIVADGANELAAFSNATDIAVTVDSPRTIGHIYKGALGQLTLQSPGPLTLSDPVKPTISNDEGQVVINVPLTGTTAFAKYGFGELVIPSNIVHSMLSGNIRVNEGELRFDSAGHTIPKVGQVFVFASGAGARLHRTGTNDPMSVYPCTFRLNGYGPSSGSNSGAGALFLAGDGLLAAVSNIVMDIGAVTRIGQVGPGASRLELRGSISGTSQPQFFARDGIKTFDFIGSNTYSAAATHFTVESGTGIFNLLGPQRLPQTAFPPNAFAGATLIVDLGSNVQTFLGNVTASDITGAGTVILRGDFGSALDLDANNNSLIIWGGGGTFRVESGLIIARKYCAVVSSGTFEMVGGELWCPLEFMPGFPFTDGPGFVNLSGSGILRAWVTRIGSESPGVVNLLSGAVLRTSAIHSTGNTPDSFLFFNGGTLSDGDWPEWNGSFTNWIQVLDNVFVQACGAVIEVNGERTIARPLKHDPALGAAQDGGLMKTGPGTLHLSAANTWNGPTVISNGILALDTPDALPAGSKVLSIAANAACNLELLPGSVLSISDGRTIAGSGSLIGSLSLAANGFLSPGASIGTFTVTSNVTFLSGAQYLWDIGPAAAADRLALDGALSLPATPNAVTVHVAIASAPDETNTYTLASALGGISGNPNSLFFHYGTTGIQGSDHPSIDGNNLVVQLIIPEPGALLFCATALGFITRKRS